MSDNTQIIEAVRAWQSNPYIHPLTCGNDSRHRNLVAVEEGGAVVLRCLDCEYRQAWIPSVVTGGAKAS